MFRWWGIGRKIGEGRWEERWGIICSRIEIGTEEADKSACLSRFFPDNGLSSCGGLMRLPDVVYNAYTRRLVFA